MKWSRGVKITFKELVDTKLSGTHAALRIDLVDECGKEIRNLMDGDPALLLLKDGSTLTLLDVYKISLDE